MKRKEVRIYVTRDMLTIETGKKGSGKRMSFRDPKITSGNIMGEVEVERIDKQRYANGYGTSYAADLLICGKMV